MVAHVWAVMLDNQSDFRTLYLGHVTGYQPIRDQYFLIRSVPDPDEHDFNTLLIL